MLIGKSRNSIDNKGRISVPAKFRDDLGTSFIVTRGVGECLYIYSKDEWQKFETAIGELAMVKSAAVQRYFFANAEEVSTDTQGRILLPSHLREFAKLDKDAFFIGNCKRAEIWSAENWLKQESNDTNEEIIKQMLELGF